MQKWQFVIVSIDTRIICNSAIDGFLQTHDLRNSLNLVFEDTHYDTDVKDGFKEIALVTFLQFLQHVLQAFNLWSFKYVFLHSSELVITNMNSLLELYMEPSFVFLDQRRELWGIVFRILEKIREAGTESKR